MARSARLTLFLLLILGAPALAVAESPMFSAPKEFLLAVGDSLTFGTQPGKSPLDAANFDTGWVDVFADRLAATAPGGGIQVVNLGCPGETTVSFLAGLCDYHDVFSLPLHVDYAGVQMDAAEAFLVAHRGRASPILLSIGANDVLALVPVCGFDAACLEALLPGVLATVHVNYTEILGRLRAAAPDAEILALLYYNPFAAVAGADVLTFQLNAVIAAVAAAHRAGVVDAFPVVNIGNLCGLTFMCLPPPAGPNIHPTDLGYHVIADIAWETSGYGRFEH